MPAARSSDRERGGMGAVTIFLIVFVVLLLGAGGAGFWAWQEGYLNLDAMFGQADACCDAGRRRHWRRRVDRARQYRSGTAPTHSPLRN